MTDLLSLIKETGAYAAVKNDKINGTLSHAYLILCSDGECLSEYLKIFVKLIACRESDPCGSCRACRLIDDKQYPDAIFYPASGNVVSVADANDLIEKSFYKPVEGDAKIFAIENGDTMTAAAQNKLLKTLEEPQKTVTIFLGVSRESAMLDTVKSRTKKITLDRFSQEEISSALKEEGFPSDSAETAAACADGMLGRAKEIAEDKSFAENYAQTVNVFKNLKKSGDVASFLNEKVLDKERLPVFLDIASLIVRDMMAAKTDERLITNRRTAEEIKEMSQDYSLLALSNILYLINEERKKLNVYVSSVGVAENLLLGILEVKYKCR